MKSLIFLLIFFTNWAFAYRGEDVSALAECQWNRALLTPDADCNDLFHHYPPAKSASRSNSQKQKLRLGSFNIYKFGTSETKYKDVDLLAKIFNERWDLVAVSELQHNMADTLQFNVSAINALDAGAEPKEIVLAYEAPAYLRLLVKLQERDPSWGLFVAPFAQSSTNELYGFYYRQKMVAPVESTYCQDYLHELGKKPLKIFSEIASSAKTGLERYEHGISREIIKPKGKTVACPLSVNGIYEENTSKIPFSARFVSGNFDFTYITLHLRFRQAGTEAGECNSRCNKLTAEMAKAIGISVDTIPDKEIARYFEVLATLKEAVEINQKTKDGDTIIAGDFNLEAGPLAPGKRNDVWDKVLSNLPGAKIFVEEKTSISKQAGLANNYDHFIYVPEKGSTSECDSKTAKAVDFTHKDFVYADYFKKVKQPQNHQSFVDSYLAEFKNRYRMDDGISFPVWEVNDAEKKSFLIKHNHLNRQDLLNAWERVTRDQYKDCRNNKWVKTTFIDAYQADLYCQILWHSEASKEKIQGQRQPYRIYTGLVSDHIPIEMSCQTNQADDD